MSHYFTDTDFSNIDDKTLKILKEVNNPNVITTLESHKKFASDNDIDSYVDDLIAVWNAFKVNTTEVTSLKDTKFERTKKYVTKQLNVLDKKYKFNSKASHAVIISSLRRKFVDESIDVTTLYQLMELLSTKNRFHSGVLEIAIMTGPGEFSCKYDCYYCPNQPGIARSYIKEEPAVRRAAQNDFDCVRQIYTRISSYQAQGHPGDKGEFIILGGTFSNYSDEYRREFMRDLYYACNTYFDEVKRSRKSLEYEKEFNCSRALFKVIGLTVETRPDCIDEAEILRYISYGVTRVQLGVQHTDDKLLKKINRQCYTKDTINALTLLKCAGFKVLCHFMPNLPGATPQGDKVLFDNITSNPDLLCDEWKIYPTSVTTTSDKDIEEVFTVIEKWFTDGKYVPYSYQELEEVLRYAKNLVPNHIRISRIFRDIPVANIIGGADIPHMRQKVQKLMAVNDEYCKCIKCREIRSREIDVSRIRYDVEHYKAQEGIEYFITANYPPSDTELDAMDKAEQLRMTHLGSYLIGFCRLRIQGTDSSLDYLPVLKGAAIIRELHVYGKMVPSYLSKCMVSNTQHRGIGSRLVTMAETIAVNNGKTKMAVISGVGVRRYYQNKLGYTLEDNYMVKKLWLNYLFSRDLTDIILSIAVGYIIFISIKYYLILCTSTILYVDTYL
jgi:elongator complex protein 3